MGEQKTAWTAPFLRDVQEEALRQLSPTRIWLFGSRARGDFNVRSDVDLAFEGAFSAVRFGAFSSTIKEDARTLLALDLVDMNRCSEALRASIVSEGVLLHPPRSQA